MNQKLEQQLSLLPDFLSHHILLSVTALGLGIGISLPLAVVASRSKRLQGPLLAFASVIQTIPSLALLALMVPLLGQIGFLPALISLVLYSMLPVMRNTITGLAGVDPRMIEAAKGIGMSPMQQLFKVELPLAAPTIIAGIRTAVIWVIGIATLATPVGQTSLGNFIFTGLQTQNQLSVILGCVAAAALALTFDGIIRTLEVASVRRSRLLGIGGGIALAGVILGGLTPLLSLRAELQDPNRIVVGAKTFTEQHILAELVSQQLRQHGFKVKSNPGMGSQILFDALANNAIDCYVDYSGTIWTNVMKREDFPDRREMLVQMKRFLARNYGIVTVGRLGFENTYALAIRREQSEQLGIRSISDLTKLSPKLKLGGDIEFFGRPEWAKIQDEYALKFRETVGLNSSLMYSAVKAGEVDVIAAFSSDGRIKAFDLVVLKDDRQAFPPYDAVVLVSGEASKKPNLFSALQPLVMSIDNDAMRRANMLVDVEGVAPMDAARALLIDIVPSDTESRLLVSNTPEAGEVPTADSRPVISEK